MGQTEERAESSVGPTPRMCRCYFPAIPCPFPNVNVCETCVLIVEDKRTPSWARALALEWLLAHPPVAAGQLRAWADEYANRPSPLT